MDRSFPLLPTTSAPKRQKVEHPETTFGSNIATVTEIPPYQRLSSEAEKPTEASPVYLELKNRLIPGENPTAEMLKQAIEIEDYGIRYKSVSLLLKNGGDANAVIDNCLPDNFEKAVGLIDLLVKHGGDVNRKDSDGNTLLHHACKRGDVKGVERLIKRGAEPLVDNKDHMTPLKLAYRSCPEAKRRDVLRVLAETNPNTNPSIGRKLQFEASTFGHWDVLAWVFAEGWAHPALWTVYSDACPPELLKHLDDCFKEASKNMEQRVQENCVVTIANIMAWRGVESQPIEIAEEVRAQLSKEALAMVRSPIKIDIPKKAREMLREWISIAPEMEGTFVECAKTIKGRNPLIL
jgi:hypothetical protein